MVNTLDFIDSIEITCIENGMPALITHEIPRMQRRHQAKPLVYSVGLYNNKRHGMFEEYQTGNHTMKEIAAQFEVHYSTVSRAVKYGEEKDA